MENPFGHKVDLGAMRQEAQRARAEMEKKTRFRDYENFPLGKSRWRLLPPWSEQAAQHGRFFVVVRKHFFSGAIGQIKVAKCLIQDDGRPDASCPMCDAVEKYTPPREKWIRGQPRPQERGLSRYRAGGTVYFNAVKRSLDGSEPDKLCILQAGNDCLSWFYGLYEDPDNGDPLDTERGRDFMVTVTEQGRKKKREFYVKDASAAFPDGAPSQGLVDLSKELDVSDEDRNRAQECAGKLEKLGRSSLGGGDNYEQPQPSERYEAREPAPRPQQSAPVQSLPPTRIESPATTAAQVLADDSDSDLPFGWNSGPDGTVRPPKIDGTTGKPVCFKRWLEPARLNDATRRKSRNLQCRVCPHELDCRAKSEAGVAVAT